MWFIKFYRFVIKNLNTNYNRGDHGTFTIFLQPFHDLVLKIFKAKVYLRTQRTKMQQHLIGIKVLCNDVICVNSNNCQAQEEMKIVCLVISPASLPHTERYRLRELTFETSAIYI